MSKTRTRRPASDTRLARRSLAELTAAASRAVDDGLLVTSSNPIAASPDDPLRSEHSANTPVVARQATTPIPVAVPQSLNALASRNGELLDSDSAAEMMVKIAKDYQNRAFENIKLTLNAVLDHTKDFAETRAGGEGALKCYGVGSPENNFLAVLKGAAAEFRADTLELMKANVVTTLEYAGELAATTTAAEFVELSGTQARKQCELILKQAGALVSLAQTITKSSAE